MSGYPPPTNLNPVFNTDEFSHIIEDGLTIEDADARYLRLVGGNVGTLNVSTNSLRYFPGSTTFTSSLTMSTDTYRNGHFLHFTGGSSQTLTFPNPTSCPGYTFTLWNDTNNILNISTPSGQIFCMFPVGTVITLTNMNAYRSFIIQSNGTNWIVVGGRY